MRLLAVELRRIWARRAVAVVLLLTVVAAAVLAGSTIWSTRGASNAEVRQAQQQLRAETTAPRGDHQECLADPPAEPSGLSPEQRCEQLRPRLEWFLPRAPLEPADELAGSGLALALVLAGAAVVVGTTFAGTDWHSGSVGAQLLFTPRRLALWTAKALAVVLTVFLASLAVTAAFWLSLGVAADVRGLAVPSGLLTDVALHGARTVVLASGAALGAYALAMALRSTLVTLAGLFALTVAGQALVASLPLARAGRWSLGSNVQAWVLDGHRIFDERICPVPAGTCDPTYAVSGAQGGTYLLVLLAASVAVSLVTFRRRDVP